MSDMSDIFSDSATAELPLSETPLISALYDTPLIF
jgi:hypothetical protein